MQQGRESRYSQDQDWRVLEPEETQISETELAEMRRLQDSTSRAEGGDPSAQVLTPLLTPPKDISPKPVKHPKIPPIPDFDELPPFQNQFPDEFDVERFIKEHWHRFDPSEYKPKEMIMMIIASEMERLIHMYGLAPGHPCVHALRSLQVRFLVSHFPTMKLLLDSLMISARSLNLPEDLAFEKACSTALESLGSTFIPPTSKTGKTLSEGVLKAIQLLVPPSQASPLTKKLILGAKVEKMLVRELSALLSNEIQRAKSEPNPFFQSLNTSEKAALMGRHLVTITQIKSLLLLLILFVQELSENDDGKELAEGFLWGLESALIDNVSDAKIEEVIKSLFFVGQVLRRSGLFEAMAPNDMIQTILEDFVDRLHSPETTFAEKISIELERRLNYVNPSAAQAITFAQNILGTTGVK